MARDIDPGLTQTAIRRSPPAHNHGCGSWVCPCHGVDISVVGRGCGLGDAFRTRDRAQTPRHSLFFLLRTWWRGASTRAVADVGSSSNSRSGIEPSGSPYAPCVASATPSASAASSPSLAVANGAFGASSLTAAPKCAPISAEKRGRYPAKTLMDDGRENGFALAFWFRQGHQTHRVPSDHPQIHDLAWFYGF